MLFWEGLLSFCFCSALTCQVQTIERVGNRGVLPGLFRGIRGILTIAQMVLYKLLSKLRLPRQKTVKGGHSSDSTSLGKSVIYSSL